MNRVIQMFHLALRYIKDRPFASSVSIIAIAFSLIFLVVVGNINFAIKKAATEGSVKYPLIVGPSGASAVQTIMATIFHVDKPTGTIPFSVFEKIRKDNRVIEAYPLAVADNFQTFRIVGVDENFISNLKPNFVAGNCDFSKLENVVLGYNVAERTGLKTGDRFYGSHGMVGTEDAHQHKELQYKVTGIMAPLNSPEDSAIYVSYKTVWAIHDHSDCDHESHQEHAQHEKHVKNKSHESHKEHGDHKEHDHHKHQKLMLSKNKLTAVLVRTRNPVFTGQLEREWSLHKGTLAIDTGRTIRKVVSYLNKADKIVEMFTGLMMGIVVVMILVTIVMSLNERKKELALMRSLGISRFTISSIIMLESFIITLGGMLFGLIPGHLVLWWSESLINNSLGVAIEPFTITFMEINGLLITFISGQVLAIITMFWTYRTNIVEQIARD